MPMEAYRSGKHYAEWCAWLAAVKSIMRYGRLREWKTLNGMVRVASGFEKPFAECYGWRTGVAYGCENIKQIVGL